MVSPFFINNIRFFVNISNFIYIFASKILFGYEGFV